jgi:hypothetical protein
MKAQCRNYSELKNLVRDMRREADPDHIFDYAFGCWKFEPIDKHLTNPNGVVE